MIRGIILTVFTALIFSSCAIEQEEIYYGKDGCHFCTMTIVDTQHAAQLVTAKGKVSKYDAIECLINDLKKRESVDMGLLFVIDYSNPGELIPAESATFLISEGIPSPMDAFLSGFSSRKDAELVKKDKGGTLYEWEAVKNEIH